MTETIETGQCTVTVTLPVQYRAIRESGNVATFDLRIGGLVALYESLPQEAKLSIAEQVARHAGR